MSLAVAAAKATAEAAVKLAPDDWKPFRDRLVALCGGEDGTDAAQWTARFLALLQDRPEAAAEVEKLTAELAGASPRGDVVTVQTARGLFSRQIMMTGDGNSYVKTSAVGVSALLLLIAVLVGYLVIRPDATSGALPSASASGPSRPAASRGDSCGTALPADGADDPSAGQSYSYKVTSAAGDGRDLRPGGSIRQAFVPGRPYLSQVSAIAGVANARPHTLGFRIQRLDGTVLLDTTEDETPANNNKDVVHNIVPAIPVTPRQVLLLTVTNLSREQIRLFVDPQVSSQVPAPFPACLTGQAQSPERHADLRGNILSGSVTAQDVP